MLAAIKRYWWKRKFRRIIEQMERKYDFPHLEILFLPLPEGKKSDSGIRFDISKTIKVDLAQHESSDEIRHTAYYEFRHMWQNYRLDFRLVDFWTCVRTYSREHFRYSALEIDARRFAESRGALDDTQVFQEFGDVLQLSMGELLDRGQEVAQRISAPREP